MIFIDVHCFFIDFDWAVSASAPSVGRSVGRSVGPSPPRLGQSVGRSVGRLVRLRLGSVGRSIGRSVSARFGRHVLGSAVHVLEARSISPAPRHHLFGRRGFVPDNIGGRFGEHTSTGIKTHLNRERHRCRAFTHLTPELPNQSSFTLFYSSFIALALTCSL